MFEISKNIDISIFRVKKIDIVSNSKLLISPITNHRDSILAINNTRLAPSASNLAIFNLGNILEVDFCSARILSHLEPIWFYLIPGSSVMSITAAEIRHKRTYCQTPVDSANQYTRQFRWLLSLVSSRMLKGFMLIKVIDV